MPLTRNASGWTDWTQASGGNTVYVAANGNDSNAGTIGSPKLTLSAGYNALRDGFPDRVALRYGDVWNEAFPSWRKSGPSAAEPMGVLAYTDGTAGHLESNNPPRINTASDVFENSTWYAGGGGGANLSPMNNLAWLNFDITGPGHSGAGWSTITRGSNWLLEGIRVSGKSNAFGIVNNVLTGGCETPPGGFTHQNTNITNATLRRCVFFDNAGASHTFGAYIGGHAGSWLMEDCWLIDNAYPDIFSHQIYIDDTRGNTNTLWSIVNCGFAENGQASHGIQLRPGGVFTNCIAIRCAIGFQMGSGGCEQGTDMDPRSTLTSGFDLCGVIDGRDIGSSATPRGWAYEFMGIGGGFIRRCFGKDNAGSYRKALYLESRGTGTHGLTIEDNKFINFGPFNLEGTQGELSGIVFRRNDFQQSGSFSLPIIEHEQSTANTQTFAESANNRFYSPTNLSTQSGWTSTGTLTQWKNAVGDSTSTASQVTYTDSARTLKTYLESLGFTPASADAAYAQWKTLVTGQRRATWNDAYTSRALLTYLRVGLDMETSTPPPTPSPAYYRANFLA